MKPYLFIDVDGVLNPMMKRANFDTYEILGYTVRLSPSHGKRLLALTDMYELVWATTWQDLANEHIGPKIGLPELPVVDFGTRYSTARPMNRVMIKTVKIAEYANGRNFAWIDDDIWPNDRAYLIDMDYECFPLAINSATGLVSSDFSMLRMWGKEQSAKTSEADTGAELRTSSS